MKIGKELKDQIKANRLRNLQQRYYDLHLDLVSLEADGDTQRAEEVRGAMKKVEKAYEVVGAVSTED